MDESEDATRKLSTDNKEGTTTMSQFHYREEPESQVLSITPIAAPYYGVETSIGNDHNVGVSRENMIDMFKAVWDGMTPRQKQLMDDWTTTRVILDEED